MKSKMIYVIDKRGWNAFSTITPNKSRSRITESWYNQTQLHNSVKDLQGQTSLIQQSSQGDKTLTMTITMVTHRGQDAQSNWTLTINETFELHRIRASSHGTQYHELDRRYIKRDPKAGAANNNSSPLTIHDDQHSVVQDLHATVVLRQLFPPREQYLENNITNTDQHKLCCIQLPIQTSTAWTIAWKSISISMKQGRSCCMLSAQQYAP